MNLIGHVAVAVAPGRPAPPIDVLVGCMLPDLAAIARVRITRPTGDLGRGVELHHASDAVFHEFEWFRAVNCHLRDALIDAGVDVGPARACSHAGVEMLLDGQLVTDRFVERHAREVLDALGSRSDELGELALPDAREHWVERLRIIGTTLDPARYRDPSFVAERLHRITSGRRRIELPVDRVDTVTATLADFQASIAGAAPATVAWVRQQVRSELPTRHHQA